MAQIINEYRGLGDALGKGLGEGLSQLAQHKLDSLKSQAGAKAGIKNLTDVGVDPISARFIYDQPAKQRAGLVGDYFRQLDARNAQQQQQSPQSMLQQILQPQEEQQQSQQGTGGLQNLFNQGTTGSGINPQFLQQLMQQSQAPQPQQQMQEQTQPQQVAQEQPQAPNQPHDVLRKALKEGTGDIARERANTAKQSAIDRQNAPFNKMFTVATKNAEHALNVLGNMEQLLDTNNVSSGTYGYTVPYVLQNSESKQFTNNGDELAQLLAGQTGVAGAYKIKFNQNLKPKLADDTKTQRDRVKFLKIQAEIILKKAEIRDEIIEENGGYQLPNMETLINKRYKESHKNGASKDSYNSLPNPALWFSQHGSKPIENDETGESLVSDGKEWKKV